VGIEEAQGMNNSAPKMRFYKNGGVSMTKTAIPLKDVVSRHLVTVNPQDTLREAVSAMVENRVSALPVVDARSHCVGVLSVTDIIGLTKDLGDELNALSESGGLDHESLVQKLEHADLLTDQVQAWMSTNVVSIGIDSTVQKAARQMLRNKVHRLMVLDEEKRVIGVVSTMDLLAAFAEEE
jgi:CBS domain-containing protein